MSISKLSVFAAETGRRISSKNCVSTSVRFPADALAPPVNVAAPNAPSVLRLVIVTVFAGSPPSMRSNATTPVDGSAGAAMAAEPQEPAERGQ
jgi:hypothetical protein